MHRRRAKGGVYAIIPKQTNPPGFATYEVIRGAWGFALFSDLGEWRKRNRRKEYDVEEVEEGFVDDDGLPANQLQQPAIPLLSCLCYLS